MDPVDPGDRVARADLGGREDRPVPADRVARADPVATSHRASGLAAIPQTNDSVSVAGTIHCTSILSR